MRAALAVCFSLLAAPATAQVIRQPYLQSVTEDSATIVWRTGAASPGDSRVHYGLEARDRIALGEGVVPPSNAGARDHVVTIGGLSPATTYFYDVGTVTGGVDGGGTALHYFRTAPARGAATPFTAWILGDSGTATAAQRAVRDAMLAHTGQTPPDLFLHVGDLAYDNGTDGEFTAKHFAVYANILRHTPFWPAIGNHEVGRSDSGAQRGPYYDGFVLPSQGEAGGVPSGTEAYYAFDYANVHFIVLDTADSSIAVGSAQLLWLEADLAATEQDWVVATFHHPPYSKGNHDSDNAVSSGGRLRDARENIVPLLEAGGVDLVVAGHSHLYERSYLLDSAYGYGNATPAFAVLLADGRVVDAGDGDPAGDGAYSKPPGGGAHEGAVYMVAGHGGRAPSGSANHPVMAFSELANGSVLLSVNGPVLTARNVRSDGTVTDTFSIRKAPLRCDDAADCEGGRPCSPRACEANTCVRQPVQCGEEEVCDPDSGECVSLPTVRTLQDGLDGYAGTLDTYLAEGAPDSAFGAEAAAGWDLEDATRNNTATFALVRFAISEQAGGPVPDGAEVTRATLRLTHFNSGVAGQLHAALVDWDESVTYASFGPVAGVQPEDHGVLEGEVGGAIGVATVDVTSSVRAWLADPQANRGWVVVPVNTSGVEFRTREHATADERPALVVSYVTDRDDDEIPDAADNCPDVANADQADADEDGAGDVCDACPGDADDDADGDDVCGDVDNCAATANVDQADADDDGAGDACDACPRDPANDVDGDDVCGDDDNCPLFANAGQEDADDDGVGDACDACALDADDDADRDEVCGDIDNCPAVRNAEQTDTDGDGAGDACDVCPGDAEDDADGDERCGDVDNCPEVANPDQADADEDGAGDACDVCPADPDDDADGDERCGDVDNCAQAANPDQADADEDGRGDACDVCPSDPDDDADADEVCGDVDNCAAEPNADQADADEDGAGDVCDLCPADPEDDQDDDGVCDGADVCPRVADPQQGDADGDGAGDACDEDDDDDGRLDPDDNCPLVANPGQADLDDDGLGNACDPDGDGDGVPDAWEDDHGMDPRSRDSDDDTIDDLEELGSTLEPRDTDGDQRLDALDGDSDGDGVDDVDEAGDADLATPPRDTDGDGRPDYRDPDSDDDGVDDGVDNCPLLANPDQADGDGDGAGDLCDEDPLPADAAPPDADRPDAAVAVHNEPTIEAIGELIAIGLLVRTRADGDGLATAEQRAAAFSSGSQIISTDLPPGHPNDPAKGVVEFAPGKTLEQVTGP